MLCLGKHVHGLQLRQPIAAVEQTAHIPGLGGRIAGNIDDPKRVQAKETVEDIRAAADSRRVQNGDIDRVFSFQEKGL